MYGEILICVEMLKCFRVKYIGYALKLRVFSMSNIWRLITFQQLDTLIYIRTYYSWDTDFLVILILMHAFSNKMFL